MPIVQDHPYPLSWESMLAKNQVKRKPQGKSNGGNSNRNRGDGNMSGKSYKPRNASSSRKFNSRRKD